MHAWFVELTYVLFYTIFSNHEPQQYICMGNVNSCQQFSTYNEQRTMLAGSHTYTKYTIHFTICPGCDVKQFDKAPQTHNHHQHHQKQHCHQTRSSKIHVLYLHFSFCSHRLTRLASFISFLFKFIKEMVKWG